MSRVLVGSTWMPGPIVEVSVTFLMYLPLAAEGFARTYGKDVMAPESAGLAPALEVPLETQETMQKNLQETLLPQRDRS